MLLLLQWALVYLRRSAAFSMQACHRYGQAQYLGHHTRYLSCRGFKLLAAMGYTPGQGLGKSVEGRTEPIPLDLKQNRLGLGAENKKAAAREAQRHREREAAGELAAKIMLAVLLE